MGSGLGNTRHSARGNCGSGRRISRATGGDPQIGECVAETAADRSNQELSQVLVRRSGSLLHQAELREQPELVVVRVVSDDLPVAHSRDISESKIDSCPGRLHIAVVSGERTDVGAGETPLHPPPSPRTPQFARSSRAHRAWRA